MNKAGMQTIVILCNFKLFFAPCNLTWFYIYATKLPKDIDVLAFSSFKVKVYLHPAELNLDRITIE